MDNRLISGKVKSIVVDTGGDVLLINTDGSINADPNSVEFKIQHDHVVGGVSSEIYNIMGSRSRGWVNTSTLGDCCEYLDTSQSIMNTPTSDQTLYIVSSNANDTSNGTGVRTVKITYLDASGLLQAKTVAMNGTTPVSLGSGHSFIEWIESASVGSNTVAVGDISVSSTNGASTVATTFDMIAAGGNRSLSGRFKVPSDCHAHIIHWSASAISATMDTRLRADTFAADGLSSGVFHFKDRIFLGNGQNSFLDLSYEEISTNAVIKVSAFPGSAPAGNKLDAHFSVICSLGIVA